MKDVRVRVAAEKTEKKLDILYIAHYCGPAYKIGDPICAKFHFHS